MTLSSHTAPDVRPLLERLCLVHRLLLFSSWPVAKAEQRSPFAPAPLQGLRRYYGLLRPCAPSVLSPSRLEPLAACPFTSSDVTNHRFSRSIRKPGRASRRLHAGCRSGSI